MECHSWEVLILQLLQRLSGPIGSCCVGLRVHTPFLRWGNVWRDLVEVWPAHSHLAKAPLSRTTDACTLTTMATMLVDYQVVSDGFGTFHEQRTCLVKFITVAQLFISFRTGGNKTRLPQALKTILIQMYGSKAPDADAEVLQFLRLYIDAYKCFIYIHTHICIYIYTNMCMYIYIYVCVCVKCCIYIYIYTGVGSYVVRLLCNNRMI